DLPVYLWFPGARRQAPDASRERNKAQASDPGAWRLASGASPDARLAAGVWHLADAVIWSARGATDALPAAPLLTKRPAVVDLDWLRLEPWQELTAQWFDAPGRRGLLEQVEVAEITVGGPLEPRPGAGWLG